MSKKNKIIFSKEIIINIIKNQFDEEKKLNIFFYFLKTYSIPWLLENIIKKSNHSKIMNLFMWKK